MDTLANRNNNPGNLRDTKTGEFRNFSTPQEGYAALLNDLQAKQTGTTTTGVGPSSTLADFSKVYAPAGDKNDPAQYTANLANHMKVRPDAQLKDLNLGAWADSIAHAEGYKSQTSGRKTFSSAIAEIQKDRPAEPEKKEGFGKSLLKSVVKSPLTILARPVQAVAGLMGASNQKIDDVTKSVFGDFIAPTPKGALDVGKDILRAGETVATGYGAIKGVQGLSSLFKAGSALKSPEVIKVLSQATDPGKGLSTLTRDQAVKRITAKLSSLKISEVGGQLEQNLLKALKELVPALPEKAGLIRKLISGSKIGLLDLIGAGTVVKPLVAPAVGAVKEAVTGTGKFSQK